MCQYRHHKGMWMIAQERWVTLGHTHSQQWVALQEQWRFPGSAAPGAQGFPCPWPAVPSISPKCVIHSFEESIKVPQPCYCPILFLGHPCSPPFLHSALQPMPLPTVPISSQHLCAHKVRLRKTWLKTKITKTEHIHSTWSRVPLKPRTTGK